MSFEVRLPTFAIDQRVRNLLQEAQNHFQAGRLLQVANRYAEIIGVYEAEQEHWQEKAFFCFDYAELLKWVNEIYKSASFMATSAYALEMIAYLTKDTNGLVESVKRYLLAADRYLIACDKATAAHCLKKAGLHLMNIPGQLDLSNFESSVHGVASSQTFAGNCFEKAAKLHEAEGELAEGVGNYFFASQEALKGRSFCSSFCYLSKAILLHAKRTGSVEELHKACPAWGDKTINYENVIQELEARINKSSEDFFHLNPQLGKKWVASETLLEMKGFFLDLTQELSEQGNENESDRFWVLAMQTKTKLFWQERKLHFWIPFVLWACASQFGTNFFRWFGWSVVILLLFACLFSYVVPLTVYGISDHPVIFSISSFVNISSVNGLPLPIQVWSLAESVIGIVMLAILIQLLVRGRVRE